VIRKILLLSFCSLTAVAMKLKPLEVKGSGCEVKGPQTLEMALSNENTQSIPLKIKVEKASSSPFARKACQFSLAIAMDKNEKIKITDIEQPIHFNLGKGSEAQVELSIFFAGSKQKKKPFVFEEKATEQTFEETKKFKSDSQVIESDCGKDLILRGLLSAYIKGSPAEAQITSESLALKIKIEKCP
jgi:hypothetical protein